LALEGKYLDLEGEYLGLEDKYLDLEDKYLGLEDKYLALEDKYLALEDKYLALEDKYLALEGKYLGLEGKYLDLRGIFPARELCLLNRNVLIQSKLLTSLADAHERLGISRHQGGDQGDVRAESPTKRVDAQRIAHHLAVERGSQAPSPASCTLRGNVRTEPPSLRRSHFARRNRAARGGLFTGSGRAGSSDGVQVRNSDRGGPGRSRGELCVGGDWRADYRRRLGRPD